MSGNGRNGANASPVKAGFKTTVMAVKTEAAAIVLVFIITPLSVNCGVNI